MVFAGKCLSIKCPEKDRLEWYAATLHNIALSDMCNVIHSCGLCNLIVLLHPHSLIMIKTLAQEFSSTISVI